MRQAQARGKQGSKDSQGSAEMQLPTQIPHDPPSDLQNNTPEAPVVDSSTASVSSNKRKRVTCQDVRIVQNLIEMCLQLYMDRDEVVNHIETNAQITPGFTTVVWQKLEEQNEKFFHWYYVVLILKKQIIAFNKLLEQQKQHLMNHSVPPNVPMASTQGIHHMPSHAQIDSMSSMSSNHAVNGIHAEGIHPMQINSGMVMDRNAVADTISFVPPIQPEMSTYPISVASNGHFPLTPTEITELSANTLALNSTFTSLVPSRESWQHGLDRILPNSNEPLESLSQIPGNSNEPLQASSQIPGNSELSVDTSALYSTTVTSHVSSSEGLQLGLDEPLQSLSQIRWNSSFSDLTAGLTDMDVEDYFVDYLWEEGKP